MNELPPLKPQTPTIDATINSAPTQKDDNEKKEPEKKEPVTYFYYSSWPDLRLTKPGKPEVQFRGRLLATDDEAVVAWLHTVMSCLPANSFQIKELSPEEYEKYLSGELS